MSTLATVVDGLKLPNPFVIGSGPPGTNLNVITRAFREGWGAVIARRSASMPQGRQRHAALREAHSDGSARRSSAGKTSS